MSERIRHSDAYCLTCLRKKHRVLQAAHDDVGPVLAVRAILPALAILGVDKLSSSVAVRLQGAQDIVVDLSEEDSTAVCAGRMVACQMDASDDSRSISTSVFTGNLRKVVVRGAQRLLSQDLLTSYTVAYARS